MSDETLQLDELDRLATEAFPGLVVRKDLLRRMRSRFSVPAFVIEFLLGKYCASTDEEEIREGLEFVRETLGAKFVKPDEREAVKSSIKQHFTYEIIDKLSVRLVETHDKYWARLSNLNQDFINIDDSVVREHDRLLMGGIWAEIVLRYDDSLIFKGQNRPFFVERLRPIQLSTRNVESFVEGRRRFTTDQWLDLLLRSMYWDTSFSYIDRGSGQETFVPVPEMGGGTLIAEDGLLPGSVYTIGTDTTDDRLALFLLQTQMNRGSGRIIPLGNLSSTMKDAIKTADAYLKANLNNLGIDHDLRAYDFTVQAINLNQAKEGSETAVAFFVALVSCLLSKPLQDQTVVLGEMSVQGMLLKVSALPERMQLAVESGAKRILIPSENKRDVAEVPDAILTAIQWQFYDSPIKAAILATGAG